MSTGMNSPTKTTQPWTNDLASVIDRVQQNADQVEKKVLQTEKLLVEDIENEQNGSTLKHFKQVVENLSQVESLIIHLYLDVGKVKKLEHPQARMIEQDIDQLNDRWNKNCAIHRDLYNKLNPVCQTPGVDWSKLLSDKQTIIFGEVYGPHLPDVEKQIAAHNILHQQIEEYRSALQSSNEQAIHSEAKLFILSQQQNSPALQHQYGQLLEASEVRRQGLSSLFDFLQRCRKKTVYLTGQQRSIIQRDWSDLMTDSAQVRLEYDRFVQNELESHEGEINKLQEEADILVGKKHPGATAIEFYSENLHVEWRCFLNICICHEKHLDNVDNYKKYQLDVETFTESLKRIKSSTEPSVLRNMSNPEILMQLEGEERAVTINQQKLSDLREFCSTISPLHLRRTPLSRPISIISLCDWSKEDSVKRGDKYTLVSDPREENWQVKSSTGETKIIPGVCFLIPPPDSVAIDRVDSLIREFSELKRTISVLHTTEKTKQLNIHVEKSPGEKSPGEKMTSLPERFLHTLDDLDSDSLKRFRFYLKLNGSVSASRLENADSVDIVERMVEGLGANEALNVMLEILRKIKQNNLAEQLQNK